MKSVKNGIVAISITLLTIVLFQNCSGVKFDEAKLGSLGVCDMISCELDPLTEKPAVTTLLLALGDEADSQLVVNGASAQLIAETVVRYSSEKANPRILVVRDSNAGAEDPEDTDYALNVLLSRYNVTYKVEPSHGLNDSDLAGFDLVWFNNPGQPMGVRATYEALLRFRGGVVLQGDDLTRGTTFDMEELTGLKFISNGTEVTCNGATYPHNDNFGERYRVSLNPSKVPGANNSTIQFLYGNDIDETEVLRSDLEILATAVGGPSECFETRPAIVRYLKSVN